MTSEKLLTPAEAGARIGVAQVTLPKRAQRGGLPGSVSPGGRRRFTRDEIDGFAICRRLRQEHAKGTSEHDQARREQLRGR